MNAARPEQGDGSQIARVRFTVGREQRPVEIRDKQPRDGQFD